MNYLMNNIWLILLGIYIISPFDAHPLFLDDLIALGLMLYLRYKKNRQKQQYNNYYSHEKPQPASEAPLTLDESYEVLGVSPSASLDEINKAYKNKIAKSHPDKVSHLSEELQKKARELTLKINQAVDLIKQHKKNINQ